MEPARQGRIPTRSAGRRGEEKDDAALDGRHGCRLRGHRPQGAPAASPEAASPAGRGGVPAVEVDRSSLRQTPRRARTRLTGVRRIAMSIAVSWPDGRSGKGRKAAGEESPGSMETRCRVTPGGGDPRESATESKPPARVRIGRVRVKGWGKSPPRDRQRDRHGKPHREQYRIGATWGPRSPGPVSRPSPG